MITLKNYCINQDTILIRKSNDCKGVIVLEDKTEYFISSKETMLILEESINYYRSVEWKVEMNGARLLFAKEESSPIIIQTEKVVCLFPGSPPEKGCIYFSVCHVLDAQGGEHGTEVLLSSGARIHLKTSFETFSKNREDAEELLKITLERKMEMARKKYNQLTSC